MKAVRVTDTTKTKEWQEAKRKHREWFSNPDHHGWEQTIALAKHAGFFLAGHSWHGFDLATHQDAVIIPTVGGRLFLRSDGSIGINVGCSDGKDFSIFEVQPPGSTLGRAVMASIEAIIRWGNPFFHTVDARFVKKAKKFVMEAAEGRRDESKD